MTELNPELIEHTPTTGQVMDAYVHINPEDASATPAAFDRWLSAVIREAKAEALREAADAIDLEDAAKQSDLSDLDYYWTGHYWESVTEEWLRARAGKTERGES